MKDTTYNPNAIEQHWYKIWEQKNYFAPSGKGEPFCIAIPPPNVTGTLHMGHGFQQSLMDAIIRYKRMSGFNTLWQIGTDHAGIATQMVVETQLRSQGTDRHQLGRDAFVQRIWDWKKYSHEIIAQQERRIGISGDWERERFTLDEGLAAAVQYVFIKMYEEGLIYRGQRLVNWDPVLKTAISDLEVINEDCEGSLWYIRYPVVNSTESLIIATTRPETMLGDVAVAVHPDDPRYQHLIGKDVQLPLTKRVIPIIADEYVDKTFGTGCVKITPAHDFNDYGIGQRHKLPLINIFTEEAHINENAPEPYQGLTSIAAREKVLADLKALDLLIKTERHQLKIPKGDRSGAIIEPYLTYQWFVKAKELAGPAIEVVKTGKIKFIPENWSKIYFQWLENIEDWCISRQLWWGHRIPAWYDEKGNVYVGHNEKEIREKHKLENTKLTQDEDVLDTWFSSALWPFSTLGWPQQTEDFKTFYPTSVLATGFDIIFFWVARMVMMGLKFTDKIPFKEIYITGLIRDSKGQKMSKSKGNVLDPVDLIDGITLEALVAKRTSHLMQQHRAKEIEQHTRAEFPNGIPAFGADALRFTFCALATTSRDINFDVGRLEGYRNFCTKIWNAARYVLMQLEGFEDAINRVSTINRQQVFPTTVEPRSISSATVKTRFIASQASQELSLVDRWIQSELNQTIQKVITEFDNYRFDLITQAIYDFTWHEFCDWYLELCKPILISEQSNAALKNGTRTTLLTVLETLLRLMHPFMPFITEEIWQHVAQKMNITGSSIMIQKYPQFDTAKIDENATAEINWLKKVILAIRNIRGEMNLSPTKPLPLLLNKGTTQDKERINQLKQYLIFLARLESIAWIENGAQAPASASAIIDNLEIHIPMANLIDKNAEIARLTKEINKLQQETDRISGKLNNANYVAKAPADVVAKDQQKLTENTELLAKLKEKLLVIEKMI